MTKIYNRFGLKSNRKKLRNNPPEPEKQLWLHLRKNQLKNYKFRRQFSIGKYIVDFYCPQLKLAIEIDGESHFINQKAITYDLKRQKYIESLGIKLLRFTNKEVCKHTNETLEIIHKNLP